MSIAGIQNGNYQKNFFQGTQQTNNKAAGDFSSNALKLTAVGGKATMLCQDALVSIGSFATGESANVYRAEEYSEENPLYLVKGMDANGNEYEQTVDVSKVNPNNCSFIELLALNAHTGNVSDKNLFQASIIRDQAGAKSYFDKADYLSAAYEFMAEQKKLGNWNNYLSYGKWIQSILDYSKEK